MAIPLYVRKIVPQLWAQWRANGHRCVNCGVYSKDRYECLDCMSARRRQQRNQPQFQAKQQARRSRRKGLSDHFTGVEWNILCAHYGNICLCCKEAKRLEPDHVIPLSKGGTNSIDNIQPLCHECNNVKRANHVDYRVNAPFIDIRGVPDQFFNYIIGRFRNVA